MNKIIWIAIISLFLSGCRTDKEYPKILSNSSWQNENITIHINSNFTIINHGSSSVTAMPNSNEIYVYKRVSNSDNCLEKRLGHFEENYYCFIGKVNIHNKAFHGHFSENRETYAYVLVDKYGSTILYYQFLSKNEIVIGVTYGTGNVLWLSRIQND